MGDYRTLDSLFHSRIRLAVVSALVKEEILDFNELKRIISATEGNLSTHIRKLEEAGYLSVDKTFEGRKPKTNYTLTPKGRKAFGEYIAVLESFLH